MFILFASICFILTIVYLFLMIDNLQPESLITFSSMLISTIVFIKLASMNKKIDETSRDLSVLKFNLGKREREQKSISINEKTSTNND